MEGKSLLLYRAGWLGGDVCCCVLGDLGMGGDSRFPEFPSVWPPYTLGALETPNVGEHPSPPPHPTRHHDNNKHVSPYTPEQSAIRFTVHEIWWRFYWPKDLSVIIYRLLPCWLWCQQCFLHPRENQGESDRDKGWRVLVGVSDRRGCGTSVCMWKRGEKVIEMSEGGRRIHPPSSSLWGAKVSVFSSFTAPPFLFLQRWHRPTEHRREKSAVPSLGFLMLVTRVSKQAPSVWGRHNCRDPCGR